ncbi:hypothetical protein EDB19DRAFT_1846179 [Suillus lakei]|nr:hypothetical protein EDB19DRAFT_1846179 [Suillus lakei]
MEGLNLALAHPSYLSSHIVISNMSSEITYYDIEVTYPPDWAIWIPTGPGVGNTYQIIGDQDTYTLDIRRNQPKVIPYPGQTSVHVGRVAAHKLAVLEKCLIGRPITHHDPKWNPRYWVWEALNFCSFRVGGFNVTPGMTQWDLDHMMIELLLPESEKECFPMEAEGFRPEPDLAFWGGRQLSAVEVLGELASQMSFRRYRR